MIILGVTAIRKGKKTITFLKNLIFKTVSGEKLMYHSEGIFIDRVLKNKPTNDQRKKTKTKRAHLCWEYTMIETRIDNKTTVRSTITENK